MNSTAIQKCSKGRFVHMKPGYWAGNATTNSHRDLEMEPLDWKSTGEDVVFETGSNTSNITLKETQAYGSFVDYPFGIAQCTNGLCKSTAWLYNGSGTPACVGNAAGILCGECRAGTRLKLALAVRIVEWPTEYSGDNDAFWFSSPSGVLRTSWPPFPQHFVTLNDKH